MTTLIRFEPFRQITARHNDLDGLMNGILERASNGAGTNGNGAGTKWVPAVDVWETVDDLVYAFDLPGIPEDKISVELEDGVLTVTGERERAEQVKEDGFYRYERHFGRFQRAIRLPSGATDDGVNADFRNGVLEIHVAKPAQPKPRRIPLGASKPAAIED
jgi:HSP20 family protein